MDSKRTIRDYLRHNPTMVETLRDAANYLQRRHPILAGSLYRYSRELMEYDYQYSREFINPFKPED